MGRKRIYTEDERKQNQREHALRCYFRKKALKQALEQGKTVDADGLLTVTTTYYSDKLGQITEDITYKLNENGKFIKQQGRTPF